jgi:hypothetical protein
MMRIASGNLELVPVDSSLASFTRLPAAEPRGGEAKHSGSDCWAEIPPLFIHAMVAPLWTPYVREGFRVSDPAQSTLE